MTSVTWRKRFSVWRNRLYLYPPPEPMPFTRSFWVATALVAGLVILFSVYFILFTVTRNAAYWTHGEDLGIMDQALWNTVHGSLLHQSICNIISDTNCLGLQGYVRLAIHFEPILLPLSLIYLVLPGPNTLLVIQVLVVATGAFPAFWLARLRLRNDFAGVAIALVYLFYPAQQNAIVSDFHAVAFTAAFLLFTLYFMYTRRTVWLFVFAILAMACKEEIPLVIIMFGLWSMLFQRRWRSGGALVLVAAAWIGVYLIVSHIFSPVGHPLLESRYSYLGNSPLQMAKTVLLHPLTIIQDHVLEPLHFFYLRLLLTPAGYLPILAPWVLILALPSVLLNMLSTKPDMYSGLYQYNAEIVPVLIFATIEAIVLIIWFVQWFIAQGEKTQKQPAEQDTPPAQARQTTSSAKVNRWIHTGLLILLACYALFSVVRADARTDNTPLNSGFTWPQVTPHIQLAQHFINMIPPAASVSAQSDLIPHISERRSIYLFPYADDYAQYIFLDVTGNIYPFSGNTAYVTEVRRVMFSGPYGIAAAQDGYLLLERGLPAPGVSPHSLYGDSSDPYNLLPNLPPAFCSFTQVPAQQVQQQVPVSGQATISSPDGSSTLNLSGWSMKIPPVYSLSNGGLQVFTYWKVTAPTTIPLQFEVFITDQHGKQYHLSNNFPALTWCPTSTWQPGTTVAVPSNLLYIQNNKKIPFGLAHVSLAIVPATQTLSTIMNEQAWYSVNITRHDSTISATDGGKALQLATIQIVP